MTRGRKPKANAQRRGGTRPTDLASPAPAAVVLDQAVRKPERIAENPLQSECWDNLVGLGFGFEACDLPLLEAYCFWYSVLRQAQSNTIGIDGRVTTLLHVVDGDGNPVGVAGVNPDIKTAEKATNMLRHLGDALRISPAARDKAALMQAVTKSTQADVVRKTIDSFEQFQAAQKALNAAK